MAPYFSLADLASADGIVHLRLVSKADNLRVSLPRADAYASS